jgi:mono/diheme cytochrome c family protein
MPDLTRHGIDDVVLATWKQTCTPCHGLIGRGDGPQGAVLHPTDLTSAVWQGRAIDSEIAYTIHKGRGRMPGFAHIPDATVAGLVRLVRMLGPAPQSTAAGTAEPKPTDSNAAH